MSCSDSSIVNAGNLRLKKSHQPIPNVTSTPAVHFLPKHLESTINESSSGDDNVFRAVPTASSAVSASGGSSSSQCKTPARNFAFGGGSSTEISMMKTPSSGGQGGSSERFRRARGILLTPSGPRINPFESQLSTDALQGPTFSPSVFSTVVSPSQDEKGGFWTLDQQARLFPAHISDDSPWKQEAVSRLDPEAENRTQEAIDLYFSRHSHQITSPEDLLPVTRSMISYSNRSSHHASLGESPNLTSSAAAVAAAATPTPMESSVLEQRNLPAKSTNFTQGLADLMNSSESSSSCPPAKRFCSQWTQTVCTFPSELPPEVENILAKYFAFDEDQSCQPKVPVAPANVVCPMQQVIGGANDEGNNSTLRRKLFAGLNDDDDGEVDSGKEDKYHDVRSSVNGSSDDEDDLKENEISNIVPPGSVMMTPTAEKKERSPNKSLSWSLSPVSRKKGPLGSSTPTK